MVRDVGKERKGSVRRGAELVEESLKKRRVGISVDNGDRRKYGDEQKNSISEGRRKGMQYLAYVQLRKL